MQLCEEMEEIKLKLYSQRQRKGEALMLIGENGYDEQQMHKKKQICEKLLREEIKNAKEKL